MLAEIKRLSVAERLQLVEDILGTIAAEPEALPLPQAQRDELDRRLQARQQRPQEGTSWPQLRATLTSR